MLFRRKSSPPPEVSLTEPLGDSDVAGATRVEHGRYTILALPRQLHNGKWIVRIVLEEARPDGPRRYDFAGSMAEFSSESQARDAGIEYAKKRLDRK